ncbi:reverse transcriptase domain-containing protein [Tanacetum coccineum]
MRTRSQTRNRNHQQQSQPAVVQPFHLEEPFVNPPLVPMADNRTMAQLLQAPTEGYEDAIITSTMGFPDIPSTSIKLMLFPFSLEGSARIWLEKEPPRSILTWDDLVSKFINQFFPPSKTTNLHTFYNALNANDQDSLNSVAGGNFLDKMPRECFRISESKSKVCNSRNKAVVAKVSSNSSTPGISPDVAALTTEVSELKNMMKTMLIDKQKAQAPAPVKAVEQSCVTCGGAHSYKNCPATDGNVYRDNIQEYVSQAAAANFNQGNTNSRPPMVLYTLSLIISDDFHWQWMMPMRSGQPLIKAWFGRLERNGYNCGLDCYDCIKDVRSSTKQIKKTGAASKARRDVEKRLVEFDKRKVETVFNCHNNAASFCRECTSLKFKGSYSRQDTRVRAEKYRKNMNESCQRTKKLYKRFLTLGSTSSINLWKLLLWDELNYEDRYADNLKFPTILLCVGEKAYTTLQIPIVIHEKHIEHRVFLIVDVRALWYWITGAHLEDYQDTNKGLKEVIDIDVPTEEAAELMVVSSTSLTEATRKAAASERIAKKKTHSPKQPSSTPISKSADDIMTFRKELDALALKHLGPVPATAPTHLEGSLKKITEAHGSRESLRSLKMEAGVEASMKEETVAEHKWMRGRCRVRNKARLVAQGHCTVEGLSMMRFCTAKQELKLSGGVMSHKPPGFVDHDHPSKALLVGLKLFVRDLHSPCGAWYFLCDEFEADAKQISMSSMGELTFFLGLKVKSRTRKASSYLRHDSYSSDSDYGGVLQPLTGNQQQCGCQFRGQRGLHSIAMQGNRY